ncbi:MAG TPA: 4-alpha-glucanotransferase [Pyrinomonadaceae bacterium]|jgi:4-alpha-glucanotransferase
MIFPRASGILLHPTSMPGRFGIGDLGDEAYRFADFLVAAGQTLWQVLPLGPTGYGGSPYLLFRFRGQHSVDLSGAAAQRRPDQQK